MLKKNFNFIYWYSAGPPRSSCSTKEAKSWLELGQIMCAQYETIGVSVDLERTTRGMFCRQPKDVG